MSVYIMGMEMPEHCAMCIFHGVMPGPMVFQHWCKLTGEHIYNPYKRREEHCPIIPVPDHGDLIDRQKLLEDNKHLEYPTDCKYRRDRAWAVGFNAGAKHCNEHAYYAKTVIPADKEAEG